MSATKRRNHKRYPGDPTEATQARLVDHVLAALGAAVSREQAQRLLEQAGVWTFIPMRQLDQHLTAHPHALTAPDPFAPRALLRLVAALNAAGFADVIPLPRCAGCQRTSADLVRCGRMHPDGIGRCCQACILKVESIVCARCGNEGVRSARRPEGVICRSCYGREPERRKLCTSCGRMRTPGPRTDDGQPLCKSCAPRPVHPCAECGQVAPAHVVTATGSVCRRCYQAPQRACGGCGRIRRIIKRSDGIRPDLCSSCKHTPVTACGVCGRFRRCSRGSDNVDRYQGCTPRPERICGICSQQRTTHARLPMTTSTRSRQPRTAAASGTSASCWWPRTCSPSRVAADRMQAPLQEIELPRRGYAPTPPLPTTCCPRGQRPAGSVWLSRATHGSAAADPPATASAVEHRAA